MGWGNPIGSPQLGQSGVCRLVFMMVCPLLEAPACDVSRVPHRRGGAGTLKLDPAQ
jgi:hypothetical protein